MPASFFIVFIIFISVISFGAIIAAITMIVRNRQNQTMIEEMSVRAEVVKTDIHPRNMTRMSSTMQYDANQYFVEFLDDYGTPIVLNCNKQTFETLLPGYYGDLVYKGTRLVSFVRLNEHEERRYEQRMNEGYFFEKSTTRVNPIEFYCDAPSLGVKIPSDQAIKLDVDEVVKYINRMFENTTQNFFGLDNNRQVIQFFNEGNNDEIMIDIPDMQRNGSYQAVIYGMNKVKSIVRAYYNNEDVFPLADFDFMQF